jgi:hypothetical protein
VAVWLLAVAVGAMALVMAAFALPALADPVTGAIFTTTKDGDTVNGNLYEHKEDVYLNGGPQPQPPNGECGPASLEDGDYYFQVTDPSGADLLSDDDISQRMFTVKDGVISAVNNHATGTGKCGSLSVQLIPYKDTTNSGGEYKVWVTPVASYTPDQGTFGFIDSQSKTDNFKISTPLVALSATKTAAGSYDRTNKWDLTKTVDPKSHSGTAGDSFDSDWTVTATKTATEDNFKVTGVITIKNPNTIPVDFDVTDTLDDGTIANVDCADTEGNQPFGTVPAKVGTTDGSATCNYTALPTTKKAELNNVKVISKNTEVPGATAQADVTWTANVIGDEKVTLADSRFDYSQEFSDSTKQTFPDKFTCPTDPNKYTEGKYSFKEENTATLKGASTDLSAKAAVDVDCVLPALTAVKTAKGTFDSKITWDLTKTVAPPGPFNGLAGDSFDSTWTVDATKKVTKDNYNVTGDITVTNPAAIAQTFSVSDKLDDGTVASVDCDPNTAGNQSSVTVAAGQDAKCLYTAATGNAKLNTATVTAPGNKDVVATADVSYTANVIGDNSVTLADPRFSFSQVISESLNKTFPEKFTCPTDRASYDSNSKYTKTFTNTATLKGAITNLTKSASVTLNCRYPWQAETATGAGTRYPGTSNWFMYTAFTTNKVDLIAGQKYDAGDITMARSGANTTITVTLGSGFRFANVKENLKIQDFAKAPTKYVEPGAFKYKYTLPQATTTYTATIPGNTALFYGIHASVERYMP